MRWDALVSPGERGSVLRSVEHLECLRVVVIEGMGVPGDPIRPVAHYFDSAGERFAVVDDWRARAEPATHAVTHEPQNPE